MDHDEHLVRGELRVELDPSRGPPPRRRARGRCGTRPSCSPARGPRLRGERSAAAASAAPAGNDASASIPVARPSARALLIPHGSETSTSHGGFPIIPSVLLSAKLAPCFEYPVLEEFWRASDELGFHAIWDYDHFYGLVDPSGFTYEGWTTLAAMATRTERARIGCMVTGVTYRHPAVLANMAVTVDHISGGRLEFGIGAAWHEPEHRGYGIEFPSAGTRVAMLDEALDVIKLLWTQEAPSYEGRFYRLDRGAVHPEAAAEAAPADRGRRLAAQDAPRDREARRRVEHAGGRVPKNGRRRAPRSTRSARRSGGTRRRSAGRCRSSCTRSRKGRSSRSSTRCRVTRRPAASTWCSRSTIRRPAPSSSAAPRLG